MSEEFSRGSKTISESGVRTSGDKKDARGNLIVNRGIFYTVVSIGLVAILSLGLLSVSIVQTLSDYVNRENCLATLRAERDTAAFNRAEADGERDRAIDLILIPAVESGDTPAELAADLKRASDKVQRKEEGLERANERFAEFDDTCPNATPHIIPEF